MELNFLTFVGSATIAIPPIHHVITDGGRDPIVWHWTSYCLSADNGWLLNNISTSSGLTVTKTKI